MPRVADVLILRALREAAFRIDPQSTRIDPSRLRTYFHSNDWSTSGAMHPGSPKPPGTATATGLFAGSRKREIAPYAAPRDVPWVRYQHPVTKRPTVAFAKADAPRLRSHVATLSRYPGSSFAKLPTGERFSRSPGGPMRTQRIRPLNFLRKTGHDVKFVASLAAHHQEMQKHGPVDVEGDLSR